ncbi:hypothetical protein C8A03DRAFT_39826 [Achaetomium macrosporum]|uniref:Haloacid dehalogenase n=1 Tax=Achaetomium macrosporum TaxID=79813 RepID=A0AAN7CIV1_9PEZI|nr:hypothetical protein C8A03DRAFT_39826 [Achaetomium macrosporum]
MSSPKTIIAFHLYGTLLSTDSVTGELAKSVGDEAAKELSTLWRRYQLEYTWRINQQHGDITRASLLHAANEMKLTLTTEAVARAMLAYDALHVFPGVDFAFNAFQEMLNASLYNSPDLKPLAGWFEGAVSVEDAKVFKPDRKAYDHLLKVVGMKGRTSDVWLVSANPFDALGAVAAGLRSCWVDRTGTGWIDRLGSVIGEDLSPTSVASSVDEAVHMILDTRPKFREKT